MSSVVIAGDTSGSVTLTAPSVAGTTTLTLPSTSGTVITTGNIPTGSVLQVVQTVKTDTFSTSSTITSNGTSLVNTGAAVTGLSASITPSSASNKVLVRVTFYGCGTQAVGQLLALLYRGSTVIGNSAQSGSARPGVNGRATYVAVPNYDACVSFEFLDSPSTTSSTTYQVNVGSDTGTVYVGRTQNDGDNSLDSRCSSTITLMEIKG